MKSADSGDKSADALRRLFIILGAGRPHGGTIHSALRLASGNLRVMDWLFKVSSVINPDFFFVGGYQFEDVSKHYPEIKYILNPEWESTGSVFSLLKTPLNAYTEYYVSYADILFHTSIIDRIKVVEADIVVVVDSNWHQRYKERSLADLSRCEKVIVNNDVLVRLGVDIQPEAATGEFIGLVKFSPKVAEFLSENAQILSESHRQAHLSALINELTQKNFSIKAIDVKGEWAELKESSDLAQFVLGTKAQTLGRLQNIVKNSIIENQVSFTVESWFDSSSDVIEAIENTFTDQLLIVRSSSVSEDGFAESNAGAFRSILNVNCGNRTELHTAIENVVASYPDNNPLNQVLIQPMVQNITASGVILTRTLVHGAPYYVINYDEGTSITDSITSGNSRNHKTLIALRDVRVEQINFPESIKNLLPAVEEIEQLLHYSSFDIEFGIDSAGLVHIFQIRPLVSKSENQGNSSDRDIQDTIELCRKRFIELQKKPRFIKGDAAFFGIMPDWNPAEIIGTKPGALAASLYRYLVTDEVWATQRAEYGYRDVRPIPLMVTFGGHPYTDIRASFNSFIPADMTEDMTDRLVNFYLNWLELHPHLHDKVEFEVVPTCYDFDFSKWENRLNNAGKFSTEEINLLRDGLKSITESAFKRNRRDLASIHLLERRFNEIVSADINSLEKGFILLEDCRRYGTLAFAHLARSAFVGLSLLKSAVEKKIISQNAMDSFLNSIYTITHKFTQDASLVSNGQMPWELFVDYYGHLRPGTYDINSLTYSENPDFFLKPLISQSTESKQSDIHSEWESSKSNLAVALATAEIALDVEELDSFIREAVEGREYAKFIFSRNLSAALNCFVEYGAEQGVERCELANIPLDVFNGLRNGSTFASNIKNLLKEHSRRGALEMNLANRIELPPLLFNDRDFHMFIYPENHPNYVGRTRVTADVIAIKDIKTIDNQNLAGRIVLISHADPGFDWLFGQNIAGLITMWGGANSHMAIRCAEFGLPAAIGVGEMEFQRLLKSNALELDPGNNTIQIIR